MNPLLSCVSSESLAEGCFFDEVVRNFVTSLETSEVDYLPFPADSDLADCFDGTSETPRHESDVNAVNAGRVESWSRGSMDCGAERRGSQARRGRLEGTEYETRTWSQDD